MLEASDKIPVGNAIGGDDEYEDIGDEVALVVQPVSPVVVIINIRKVHLRGVERCVGLRVKFPDLRETSEDPCDNQGISLISWYCSASSP